MLSSKNVATVVTVVISLTVGATVIFTIIGQIANATIGDPVPIPIPDNNGPPDRVCEKLTSDENRNNDRPCLRRR